MDERQKAKAANATINRELAALKRMFHLGMKSTPPKVIRLPGFPRLQENNVRKGFLEEGKFEMLINSCPELWFRTLVELGRTYGWRVSELPNLRVRNVDIISRTIRLDPGTTKNGEGREVTMTATALELLKACITRKSPEEPVFTRPDGSQVKVFRKVWVKARKAAFDGVSKLKS